jgi:hypothetical protein
MQSRKQRARLDVKRTLRNLQDSPGDADAVVRLEAQRTQDQQVEGSAQEIGSRRDVAPIETL